MPYKPSPYFNFPEHRRRLAKPTPPSPYRLRVVPDGGKARTIECPRHVLTPAQAEYQAKRFASDCGLAGHVEILELVDGAWAPTRIMDVKNSAVTGWRTP